MWLEPQHEEFRRTFRKNLLTELFSTKWDSKAIDSIKMCGWAGEWLPSAL